MSGPESTKPDDQLLDELLAEQGAVRESYRALAKEQAPAQLDAAILHAAQEAARPSPRVLRRRWQTPMAAAAVMVLSFGVFLQVQRDPLVRSEVMAVPAQPAPVVAAIGLETRRDAAEAEVLTEATPARVENQVEKTAPAAVAKPEPAPPVEKRRSAAAGAPSQPAPLPPAIAMADAPAPAVALEASEAESAAMAAASVAPSAAGSVAARESMQRQERFVAAPAPAPAPMAKASRAPQTSKLMNQPTAPAPVSGDAARAAAIEQWAQDCGAESIRLSAATLWRGLVVASWTRQVNDERTQTTLLFAPQVTREAITAALGSLAAKATITTSQCTGLVTRELLQSKDGWALQCECLAEE